jgi:hypothetical protein
LKINDIITHLNGRPLGTLNNQIAPSLVTWYLPPQSALGTLTLSESEELRCETARTIAARPVFINVTYRRYCDTSDCDGELRPYFHEYQGIIQLQRYPLDVDYPFYDGSQFDFI